MIGIQTTARLVSRGWDAAVQRRPLVVTLLSSSSDLINDSDTVSTVFSAAILSSFFSCLEHVVVGFSINSAV